MDWWTGQRIPRVPRRQTIHKTINVAYVQYGTIHVPEQQSYCTNAFETVERASGESLVQAAAKHTKKGKADGKNFYIYTKAYEAVVLVLKIYNISIQYVPDTFSKIFSILAKAGSQHLPPKPLTS